MTPVARRALWIAPCIPLAIGTVIGSLIALGKADCALHDWLGYPIKCQPDAGEMMAQGFAAIVVLGIIAFLALLFWVLAIDIAEHRLGIWPPAFVTAQERKEPLSFVEKVRAVLYEMAYNSGYM